MSTQRLRSSNPSRFDQPDLGIPAVPSIRPLYRAHASDRCSGIRDLSYRLSKQGERVGERAVLTQLIEPRTIDPRVVVDEREEGRERKGGGRGGKRRARNSDESLSACDGTSIFASSLPPRRRSRPPVSPPRASFAPYRAPPFPAFPGGVCATRRACTRDISSISRIKP